MIMKYNILTIFALAVLFFGCEKDALEADESIVVFHPELVDSFTEGECRPKTITLRTSRTMTQASTVTLSVANGDFLETTPAMSNGQIVLTFAEGENSASLKVRAAEDNVTFDYIALFRIESTTGDISTGSEKEYNLKVINKSSGGATVDCGDFIFFYDFEDCTDDFSTPNDFIERFGPGSKADRGWGCRSEGVNGSRGVRASAFGGVDGFDDAWLITGNTIDLTDLSSA